jgi:PE family
MSSYVFGSFEGMAAAAQELTRIGSTIGLANAVAAASTTPVAAGEDAVSAAIAGVFDGYAQQYQALIAQAGLFHDQFVQALNTGAGAYAATEAANVTPLVTPGEQLAAALRTPIRWGREQAKIVAGSLQQDEQILLQDEQIVQQDIVNIETGVVRRFFRQPPAP